MVEKFKIPKCPKCGQEKYVPRYGMCANPTCRHLFTDLFVKDPESKRPSYNMSSEDFEGIK